MVVRPVLPVTFGALVLLPGAATVTGLEGPASVVVGRAIAQRHEAPSRVHGRHEIVVEGVAVKDIRVLPTTAAPTPTASP